MQRLSTKYGVAYTISHCARQQWRWNSTAAAAANFTQPNKRLATNYGDISIPAAGETVSQQPWRPDAGSMAAHSVGQLSTGEARKQRILVAEQQRREERLAAEHRRQDGAQRGGRTADRVADAEQRRAKRHERLAAAQATIDSDVDSPSPPHWTRPQRPTTRSQTRAVAVRKQKQSKASVTPVEPMGLVGEDVDGADITMEEIENGGDPKPPAEFQDPEFAATDLDNLFRPSSLQRRPLTVQAIREKLGGNYSRHSPRDIPADRSALTPTQQVDLILGKRRDVSIYFRQDASELVTLSTGAAVARTS